MWGVYIIRTVDDTYYTGSTNNLPKRLKDHMEGRGAKYLRAFKPDQVVYWEPLKDKSEALRREVAIKKLTKAQKLTLIYGTAREITVRVVSHGGTYVLVEYDGDCRVNMAPVKAQGRSGRMGSFISGNSTGSII